MSFFDYAMKRIRGSTRTTVTCPICGKKSTQPIAKLRRGLTLICPKCKAMFVIHR